MERNKNCVKILTYLGHCGVSSIFTEMLKVVEHTYKKTKEHSSCFLGISFTTAPKVTDGSKAFFTKYHHKPDQLPVIYFTHLKAANLQPIGFRHTHGVELDLFCHNKVAFRKSKHLLWKIVRIQFFIPLNRCTSVNTTLCIH